MTARGSEAMSSASRRITILCTLLAVALAGGVWAADGPVALQVSGEPAPVNLIALGQDGALYVSAGSLLMLGRAVHWVDDDRTTVDISAEGTTFRLQSGSPEAHRVKRDGSTGASSALDAAPVMHEAGLLLPMSVVSDVLKAPIEWDAEAGVVRLGEAPNRARADIREWCAMLGIRRVPLFERAGIRVTLDIPQGTDLPPDQEFLLTWEADADVSLQIYERCDRESPDPLFGLSADGEIKHPFGNTVPVHWIEGKAGRVGRWPLSTSEAGTVTYVAIATDAQDPPARLLDALRGEAAVEGDWAIAGLTVTVVNADDEG